MIQNFVKTMTDSYPSPQFQPSTMKPVLKVVGLGGGGDVDKFEVVLKSRELARRVVEKYKLMPELFENEWDPLKKDWRIY